MTYEVIFSTEAEDDLLSLFDYITDNSGRLRAENYVERLETSCMSLAVFPYRGVPRDDLAPGIRTLSFEGRAVVAYCVEADTVRVLRVFYAGQDFESELSRN